ncbi:4-(cytidine 5'-diphospho)-2-C-methyl-D-erythritol kinase [Aurantimonas marina]|uniref:4-(cytidine 5'-diphospho)-2-C-methyl-D-erythritol kinase n=1 Tax=Aurantimonas marina TaxID=2780508 RepID=UPI0019D296D7|nr:4-(cytidine 5'-diphospho)-2-C-methyl-D-erythritol kinase [Aurantimonas marina]
MPPLAIPPIRLLAPAKINLALHVVGRRADGYHCLESLVVFAADIGDRITVALSPEAEDRLEFGGPFTADVPAGADNILLRAAGFARTLLAERGVALPPLAIHLDKQLPVAAGIGGGSADAAALLRMIADRVPDAAKRLARESIALGADVPMCLDGRAALITGIGETVSPLAGLPSLPLLMVNPRAPVSTAAVFARLPRCDNPALPPLPPGGFRDIAALAAWLSQTRNDLEPTAVDMVPTIDDVRQRLIDEGARFARMSGSGATVLGLFEDEDHMRRAGNRIKAANPGWWVSGTN